MWYCGSLPAEILPEVFRLVLSKPLVAESDFVTLDPDHAGHPVGGGEDARDGVTVRVLHLHLHVNHDVVPTVGHGSVTEGGDVGCHKIRLRQLTGPAVGVLQVVAGVPRGRDVILNEVLDLRLLGLLLFFRPLRFRGDGGGAGTQTTTRSTTVPLLSSQLLQILARTLVITCS